MINQVKWNTNFGMKKIDINELQNEYRLDYSIFSNIDERFWQIKDKYATLPESDKNILLLYAELGSLREVAKIIGCSHSSIRNYLITIREKLC